MKILISGKLRSGKDTTGDMFKDRLGFKIESFAAPMKEIISTTFGITLEELDQYKNNSTPVDFDGRSINFRSILQRFGTDAMQNIFTQSIWADILHDQEGDMIICDWRFKHEYRADCITIRVENDRIKSTSTHISEVDLDDFDFDYIIYNNGTLEELRSQVDCIINDLQ